MTFWQGALWHSGKTLSLPLLPFKLCFFLAIFLGREALMVSCLFWTYPGRGWGEGGMPDTAEPAGCLSTAAAAVTAWVSRREMQLLKCLPSIPGRGWHPTKAAPPIQQPKGCSFLCEPETGSAKRAFWRHVRIPYYEPGNLVLWKSFAIAVLNSSALACNNF